MRTLILIKVIFLIVGLGMLAGSFYWAQQTQQFLQSAVKTKGEVIDLLRSRSSDSTTYKPVVRFNTAEGQEIEWVSNVSSNPPSYQRGESVEILYSSAAPQDAKINSFFGLWGGSVIIGILGSVFFLIAMGMIIWSWRKQRKQIYLRKRGMPVQARFTAVELNQSFNVNGRHPYRICAQWQEPATGAMYVFYSDNIWYDPSDHIKNDAITVYMERNNPENYWVDTAFLPKLAN